MSFVGTSGSYAPSAPELAKAALGGSLVAAVIGWYRDTIIETDGKMTWQKARKGGHVVALVGASRRATDSGSIEERITFLDPDDDTLRTSQSARMRRTFTTTAVSQTFDFQSRTLSHVEGYSSNNGFIDGYLSIWPVHGWSKLDKKLTRVDPRRG